MDADDEITFQYYRERFQVTQWKDASVYQTESLGCDWFDEREVDENRPRETNIIFAVPSDEFSRNNITIRRKE